GLIRNVVGRLPKEHRLVHTAPVEVDADRPLEVVDEAVHLRVRSTPVEIAAVVFDEAVDRRDRRVDQLAHGNRLTPPASLPPFRRPSRRASDPNVLSATRTCSV